MESSSKDNYSSFALYVHGLGSGANTDTLLSVKKHLPMFEWYAVEVNEDISQSVKIINHAIEELKPAFLLGTSLGGLYLMYAKVGDACRVICNPACDIANDIRNKIGFGVKDYFVQRKDGVQQYLLDEGVCQRFEDYIKKHATTKGDNDYALFCIFDELIGPEGILSNMSVCFNSGYTILVERKEGHRLGSRALRLIRRTLFSETI